MIRTPVFRPAVAVAWLAAIPLAVAFVDRPAARFAHSTIGPHAWLRGLTLPPEYLAPLCLLLLAVLGATLVLRGQLPMLWRTLFTAALSLVIADALTTWLKRICGRTWPETWTNHNPSYIHDGIYGFFPLHGGAGWGSFPSGHMTVTSGFLMVLWWTLPRLRALWAALIALVAIGLYGMDYHFVSDMIAGTGVGTATAFVVVSLTVRRALAGR